MSRALYLANRSRVRLLLVVLSLGVATSHAAQAPPGGFVQGNAFYAAGEYAEAAAAYENAVHSGTYSAHLFYDLGNAYARLGQRGRSILNYRRALLLEPGLSEAQTNLALIRGSLSARNGGENSWLSRKVNVLDTTLWAILATAAGWVGWMLWVQGRAGRSRRRYYAAVGLCLGTCAVAAIVAWWLNREGQTAGRAIVLSAQTRALAAPAASSQVVSHLPSGSEVTVLSDQGAWIYARAPGGLRFWLATADVEKVIPQKRD